MNEKNGFKKTEIRIKYEISKKPLLTNLLDRSIKSFVFNFPIVQFDRINEFDQIDNLYGTKYDIWIISPIEFDISDDITELSAELTELLKLDNIDNKLKIEFFEIDENESNYRIVHIDD